MYFIFLGPPGAGKGTQAKILSKEIKIPHLSTGEILRTITETNNDIGKSLKNVMAKGHLVSDDLITACHGLIARLRFRAPHLIAVSGYLIADCHGLIAACHGLITRLRCSSIY